MRVREVNKVKKLAIALLIIGTLLLSIVPQPAQAGSSTDIALGLASFAVFNQLFGGFYYPPHYVVRRHYLADPPPVVYYPQPTYYLTQPVVQVPAVPSVVHYPHGRHQLYGSTWLWIPNPPAPPPTADCRLTGKYVKTPSGLQPECE